MAEQKKRWRPSLTAYRELEKKVKELESKNAVLEKSNKYMEDELLKLRSESPDEKNSREDLELEIERLKSRSFFARMFNR